MVEGRRDSDSGIGRRVTSIALRILTGGPWKDDWSWIGYFLVKK